MIGFLAALCHFSRQPRTWRRRFPIAGEARNNTFQNEAGPTLGSSVGQFLDVICPYLIVFATAAVAFSLYRSWTYGWYYTMAFHMGLYGSGLVVLLLRRRIPSQIVVVFFLGLIAMDCLQSLRNTGLAGGGLVSLTGVCILAGIFIGIRAGLLFVSGSIAVALLLSVGFYTGTITVRPETAEYLRSPMAWLLQVLCFILYTVPLIIATNVLGRKATKVMLELKEMNGRLQDEVSMRELAEGNFQKSQNNYEHILEHAAEGIFHMSGAGRLVNVNPALARMTGYSSVAEMLESINEQGNSLTADLEDEARVKRALEETGHIESLEVQLNRRGEKGPWVRLNIHPIYGMDGALLFQGTAEDITDYRRAETALRESELKYRSVVENSLVASYIVQDGFFRFVNATFSKITGYSRKELVDKMMPSDMVHPEYKRAWLDGVGRITANQSERLELELKLLSKKRSVVVVKVLAGATTYNGRIAVFGTFVDISNEKTLEAQLRQAQKMEAIGTLAGGVAHDFNNILTALTGYATLLRREVEGSETLRHYVDQILAASDKAADLTQGLLTFGKKQPLTLRPIDMNAVVKGTRTLLQRLVTEDVSFKTELSEGDLTVMADTTQIDQILFNLVSNARDAMPRGGELAIRTEHVSLKDDFIAAHGYGHVGEFAMLTVSDTGAGMDESTRERIFEPFFTTKGPGKGTGLGLSTVYAIVKQHKGYIRVSSTAGSGSTFYVYLPIIKQAGESVTKESAFGWTSGMRERVNGQTGKEKIPASGSSLPIL